MKNWLHWDFITREITNHASFQFPDQALEEKDGGKIMSWGGWLWVCKSQFNFESHKLNIGSSGGIINLTLTQDIWSEHNNWDLIYYLSLFRFPTLRLKYLSLRLLSASCLSLGFPVPCPMIFFPGFIKSQGWCLGLSNPDKSHLSPSPAHSDGSWPFVSEMSRPGHWHWAPPSLLTINQGLLTFLWQATNYYWHWQMCRVWARDHNNGHKPRVTSTNRLSHNTVSLSANRRTLSTPNAQYVSSSWK